MGYYSTFEVTITLIQEVTSCPHCKEDLPFEEMEFEDAKLLLSKLAHSFDDVDYSVIGKEVKITGRTDQIKWYGFDADAVNFCRLNNVSLYCLRTGEEQGDVSKILCDSKGNLTTIKGKLVFEEE